MATLGTRRGKLKTEEVIEALNLWLKMRSLVHRIQFFKDDQEEQGYIHVILLLISRRPIILTLGW
jgi:hypothetical protein